MPSFRQQHLEKAITSGGGTQFETPNEWMIASYGSGWPVAPVSAPRDVALPRAIDYPLSINSTITPRTGYGLMSYSSMLEAYENVTECKSPVQMIMRELTSFTPRLVDTDGNVVPDHPYNWMTISPDRINPFHVWQSKFLKSSKVYDAPALFIEEGYNGCQGLHYIDGSTLFIIVDEFGRIPKPEPIRNYVQRIAENPNQFNSIPKLDLSNEAIKGPKNLTEFINKYGQRQSSTGDVPVKIPAFAQIIKGTPYSWWSSDQIWYMPQSPRLNSPYGDSYIESAWAWIMIIVNITAFELSHYRTGNMPEGIMTLPSNLYPTMAQVLAAESVYNKRMMDNPATQRMRVRMFPDGSKYYATKSPDFPDKLYTHALHNIWQIVGIPPTEMGETPGRGLGGVNAKQGAATELGRMTLNPNRDFVTNPFNYILDRDDVDDVRFQLAFPLDEIDPDKQKASAMESLAHGVSSLNETRGSLNMSLIGDPDDPHNIANKHWLVVGNAIYIIEDMEATDGIVTVPNGATGLSPADIGSGLGEHTSEDNKTIEKAVRNLIDNGTLDGKFISIPKTKENKISVSPVLFNKLNVTHSDNAMIAVMLPINVADQLQRITESLNLPSDAQIEPSTNMHITLAYIPDVNEVIKQRSLILDSIVSIASSTKPLNGKIQGYGIFNGENNVKVLFAMLDDQQLPFIRTAICEALDEIGVNYSRDHGFVPHITMAYLPTDFKLPEGFEVPDIPVIIDCITLALDDNYTNISFAKKYNSNITSIDVINVPLEKHCGVCIEDDGYYQAPISREIVFTFPNLHHANDVEIVAMCPSGLPPKPALWKSEGGENPKLQVLIGGFQYAREEAAYLIDRSLGFYLVPLAYVSESFDEKGAAIYYTHDALPPKDPVKYSIEWIEKAAVFDYVTRQLDRGYNHNYFTHPDDPSRMILFDNGLCLSNAVNMIIHSPFYTDFKENEISDNSINSLTKCLKDTNMWSKVRELVDESNVEITIKCINHIINTKSIKDEEHE